MLKSLYCTGGTLSIGGVHNLKPRIIFLTDGYATDDSVVEGPDLTTTDQNVGEILQQLLTSLNPEQYLKTYD